MDHFGPASARPGSPPRLLQVVARHRWAMGVWLGGVACLVVMLLPVGSTGRVMLIHATSFVAVVVFLIAILRMPRAA